MQADQPPFPNTNQQVVVFDPETADLRSVPFSRIDSKLKDYCLVEIPKWDRDFDIYGTNEIAEETDSLYAVVGQGGEDIRRKSWIARLHYSSYTGFWGDMKRWSSRKHRMMYIGAMPEV